MCLCVPSQIVELHEDSTATVETMGVRKRVSVHLLSDSLAVGNYLLVHVGFAISRIDEKDALESLQEYANLREELGEEEFSRLLV
ncbi:HypC/HybG/HupF family hydrogenase formation chaperone [Sansalvadorimonas verongulae]|uniref:HypC/HybG/HupF family hydrogenase formation chaperone n=1 Tax=Sansalvadorimonas verongulae TaxID=2172824 RepID=UPI0012BD6A3F|nr:HypC/HybG/HupF family hydrogenase formation chaperone [Sansalvadorimonas verongulae]MTI15371.1 HypC/HybG/HupF family hydrogenase formation chaperone [Sansalvadorimonas verongulae]